MIDLKKHQEFLWKYKLSYGESKPKKDHPEQQVYPFLNKVIETSFEDCSTPEVKEAIDQCQSVEELFTIVSDEWKDTYFLEVSNHLEKDEFSRLLKALFDQVGITPIMTEKNYSFEAQHASEDVSQYLYEHGIPRKE